MKEATRAEGSIFVTGATKWFFPSPDRTLQMIALDDPPHPVQRACHYESVSTATSTPLQASLH